MIIFNIFNGNYTLNLAKRHHKTQHSHYQYKSSFLYSKGDRPVCFLKNLLKAA